MSEITSRAANEINRLHAEVTASVRHTLEKVLQIGELLYRQKAAMKHGEFIPWARANLTFTDRTARTYMKVWRLRDRLKSETISDLRSAYKLIGGPPREETFQDIIREIGFDCRTCKLPVEGRAVGGRLMCLGFLMAANPDLDLEPIIHRLYLAGKRGLEKRGADKQVVS